MAELICYITFLTIVGFFLLDYMYNKNNIVILLNDRCYNSQDLMRETVKYLEGHEKKCTVINNNTILVDDKKYYITENTVNIEEPIQQIRLVPAKQDFSRQILK